MESSGLLNNLYAEEMPVRHSTYGDIDWQCFEHFYSEKRGEAPEKEKMPVYAQNLRIGKEGKLNVAGALLFGKDVNCLLPQFYVAAVWFPSNHIHDDVYRSSENITGTLQTQYARAFEFIKTKLNYIQGDRGFNSVGKPEIPLVVFQELLANALLHMDCFINDSIKIFIFQNRIEIKSPGKLPNSLTVEEMKSGLRKARNFVTHRSDSICCPTKPWGAAYYAL